MRIVIDARMLYWTGVGRYTKALLDHLQEIDHKNEYVVLIRPTDRELWAPQAANFSRVEVAINPYTGAEQTRLPGVIRKLKPDLVHFTAANTPIAYSGSRVVTVHDLTLLDFDTSRGWGIKRSVRKLKRVPYRLVLRQDLRAAMLISPTQYVKDQLVRRYKVDPGKVGVTLLAADTNLAAPAALDRFSLGKQFLLFVGNVYPYKNAGLILDAMKLLQTEYPELQLVVTSQPDFFRDQLEAKARRLGLHGRLILTGFVSDGELVSLYRDAAMYIYPSLSEGFGLQGLESMAQGLPVLAANASCLAEICGDAAEYFDAHDPRDLADRIGTLLTNREQREEMRQRGYNRLKKFSWRKMAEETLELYRQAAEG